MLNKTNMKINKDLLIESISYKKSKLSLRRINKDNKSKKLEENKEKKKKNLSMNFPIRKKLIFAIYLLTTVIN